MARKRTKPVAEHIETRQTDAQLAEAATAAHEQQLAANPVDQPLPSNTEPDGAPLYPSTPPELLDNPATSIVEALADSTRIDQPASSEAVAARPSDPLAIFKDRDWSQFADPASFHGGAWPDGYRIGIQESSSRRTVELQFGDGSRKDLAKNFPEIKKVLQEYGYRWNGTNAWAKDLVPVRGSFAEREDAKAANKQIRAELEEVVFPKVIALEEEKRGPIEFADDFRQRVQNAVRGGNGRA